MSATTVESSSPISGWLLAQLPPVLAQDAVLRGFVLALEQVAQSVRERVDGLDDQLDLSLAPPEMLQFLASWLNLELESTEIGDRQRALVCAVGQTLNWRGTRYGLETVLKAATGGRVDVTDGGGVFPAAEKVPAPDWAVTVELDSTGGFTEGQIRSFVAAELPVGAVLRLVVRYPAPAGAGPRTSAP